jgi:hypothetical protein
MMYPNGQQMPPRPKDMVATNFGKIFITQMKSYERRMLDAIDSGKVFDVSIEVAALPWRPQRRKSSLSCPTLVSIFPGKFRDRSPIKPQTFPL